MPHAGKVPNRDMDNAMASLAVINVAYNQLTGTLPAWKQEGR